MNMFNLGLIQGKWSDPVCHIIRGMAEPITFDGPSKEFDVEVPGGAAPSDLEVSIEGKGKGTGEHATFGRWVFRDVAGSRARLSVDLRAGGEGAVALKGGEHAGPYPCSEHARDAEAIVWPAMVMALSRDGARSELPLKIADSSLLQDYYGKESHQEEYRTEHPFFEEFHQARLRTLKRYFARYIKRGGRVVDVGSGYGIFYMTNPEWEFDITCCDLDAAAMEKMRGLAPQWRWLTADALDLPFEDGEFDAVYAGEIIEHVADRGAALREWMRVLAPGGTMILTTPNRDRLLSRANGEPILVCEEHISEMNVGELKALLRDNGMKLIKVTGIYLELMLNWYRPKGARVDMLVRLFTDPGHRWMYRILMEAGRLFPSRAFDLVFVCRKL